MVNQPNFSLKEILYSIRDISYTDILIKLL